MTKFETHKKKLDFRPSAAQLTHSLDCASGYFKLLIFIFNFLALSFLTSCIPFNSQTSVKSSNKLNDILKPCISIRSEPITELSLIGKSEMNLNLGEKIDSSFFRQYLLIGNKNRYWKYTSDYLSNENNLPTIPKVIEFEQFNNSIIFSSDNQDNKKTISIEQFDLVKIFDNTSDFLFSGKEIISVLAQDKETLVFKRVSKKNRINSEFIINRVWYIQNIGIVQFEVLSKNNIPYLLFQLKDFKEMSNKKLNNTENRSFYKVLIQDEGQYYYKDDWAIPRYNYFEANSETGESKKIITNSTINILAYLDCANQFIGLSTDSEIHSTQKSTLNIMNLEGNEITKILDLGFKVYISKFNNYIGKLESNQSSGYDISLLSLEGNILFDKIVVPTFLSLTYEMQWFPDGSKVLFSGYGTPVYILYLNNKTSKKIVESMVSFAQISNNGDKISYFNPNLNDRSGGHILYIHDLKSDKSNEILHISSGIRALWSPDDSKLLILSGRDYYIYDLDNNKLTQLTYYWKTSGPDENTWYFDAKWSPDGKQILFNSSRLAHIYDTYLINVDGTGLKYLGKGKGILWY